MKPRLLGAFGNSMALFRGSGSWLVRAVCIAALVPGAQARDFGLVDLTGNATLLPLGFSGIVPIVPGPSPVTNIQELRMTANAQGSPIVQVGGFCAGETCNLPGGTLNIHSATLRAGSMRDDNGLTPLRAVVNFDHSASLLGDFAYLGVPLALVQPPTPPAVLRVVNKGAFEHTAGNLTLQNTEFVNQSAYLAKDNVQILLPSTFEDGTPTWGPAYAFVNASGATFTAASTAGFRRVFVERLDNSGDVVVQGSSLLQLAGGTHVGGAVFNSGPSGLISYSGLHTAVAGPGELRFLGNNTLLGDDPFVGLGNAGPGLLQVAGAASLGGNFTAENKASVVVLSGGAVDVPSGAYLQGVGAGAPAYGSKFVVRAGGSAIIAGTVYGDGINVVAVDNAGSLKVTGYVIGNVDNRFGGRLEVAAGGRVEAFEVVSSGRLIVDGSINTDVAGPGVQILGGELYGTGVINGDLNVNLGAVAAPKVFPGLSPGTLTINGAFNLNAGELELEVVRLPDGSIAQDTVRADDFFLNGTVRFVIGSGVQASDVRGRSFLDCNSACSFSYGADFAPVVDGYENTLFDFGSYGLYIADLGVAAVPVPEAQTWALLLAGLGVLGWHRRPVAQAAFEYTARPLRSARGLTRARPQAEQRNPTCLLRWRRCSACPWGGGLLVGGQGRGFQRLQRHWRAAPVRHRVGAAHPAFAARTDAASIEELQRPAARLTQQASRQLAHGMTRA